MDITMYKSALLASLGALLCGCVSQLTVSKAKPDSPGIRYFLPQPFILVTPKLDGTLLVEKVYLPDPDNEYAINASSLLGNYKLDINRNDKGFLELVSFNSDNTGVVKQLLQASGAIGAAEIGTAAAQAKNADDDAKKQADREAAEAAAADKTWQNAQLTLDIALARLAALKQRQQEANPPSNLDTQLLAATLAVQEALIRRDAALLARNTPTRLYGAVPRRPAAPEPVFFRVDMQNNNVTLKQAFAQSDRLSWQAPRADTVIDALTVLPQAQVLRPSDKNPALTATVKANRLLSAVQLIAIGSVPPGTPLPALAPLLALRPDRSSVDIELPKGMAAGDYAVSARFISGPEEAPLSDTLTLLIRIER